ncbi:nitrile hydratase subunit beta [Bradyrhizobium manausense]
MNGGHDLGGMMGFTPASPASDEPLFHAEWEGRIFALSIAAGALGEWNIDAGRFARECRSPQDYFSSTYYELWSKGLADLVVSRGLVTQEEIKCERSLEAPKVTKRGRLLPSMVVPFLTKGTPYNRPPASEPAFRPGDRVKTRTNSPTGHTRLPRYARDKPGTIDIVHGVFVFADTNAHFEGEQPHWCYSVTFRGTDLWGDRGDPNLQVNVDCWEPYLVPT